MATVNRTVREHLQKVVEAERGRTARFLVWVRAIGAAVWLAANAWFGLVENLPDWRVSLPTFAAYTGVAGLLALASRRFPKTLGWAGLAVGLLDCPVITLSTLLAVPTMARPEYLLGSLLPFLGALLVLSALSLDFRAIAVAMTSAILCAVALHQALKLPIEELFAPLVAFAGTGALCLYLVSRLRALVAESRRKDFAGKYVLGERLGSGGMAEVFAATYSPEGGFERRVAVKRVLEAYAQREDFIALFRREA